MVAEQTPTRCLTGTAIGRRSELVDDGLGQSLRFELQLFAESVWVMYLDTLVQIKHACLP